MNFRRHARIKYHEIGNTMNPSLKRGKRAWQMAQGEYQQKAAAAYPAYRVDYLKFN